MTGHRAAKGDNGVYIIIILFRFIKLKTILHRRCYVICKIENKYNIITYIITIENTRIVGTY